MTHMKNGNVKRKERMSASFARGEQRKAARVAAQDARAAANRERRANGEPTPWEIAKAARSERRAAKQAKYRVEHTV